MALFLLFLASNLASFQVCFRFVFQGSSFIFKYLLASFALFFIFCSSQLSPLGGAGRFLFARRGQGQWFATDCP